MSALGCAECAAGARDIFDAGLLPGRGDHSLRQQAGERVARAARRERHDQIDAARRKILRLSGRANERQYAAEKIK